MTRVGLERWEAAAVLGAGARRLLASGTRVQLCAKGETLCVEGMPVREVGIVLSGAVELYGCCPDRREAVIEILHPQEGFGFADALGESGHLAAARMLHPGEVLWLAVEAIERAMATDTALGRLVYRMIAQRTHSLIRQVKDLKLRTGTQRLGCFLLRLIDEGNDPARARIPFPKAVLASRLGMTPETLSRALGQLREIGLEVRGSHVHLLDRARIEAVCRPHPLIDGGRRVAPTIA